MKLKNKLFTGLICLSAIAITACGDKNNDGPSTPANPGTFTGKFTSAAGEVSQWTATSATAVLDTSVFGDLTITATNASGDVISIVLSDGQETAHLMNSNTNNYSIYSTANLPVPPSTESDDATAGTNGNISITDNGDSDNLLKGSGNENFIKWVKVDPDTVDKVFGFMENISFSAPLTRVGFTGGGGESSLAFTIDGNAFSPIYTSSTVAQGMFLIISSDGNATVTVSIPSGATTGDHDLSQSTHGYTISYVISGSTTSYTSTSGTMNISAINATAGTITGTFSCSVANPTGTNAISMTNGSFSVN